MSKVSDGHTLPPHRPVSYGAIRFAVAHDKAIMWVATAAVAILGVYLAWRAQQPDWAIWGLVGAAIVNAVARLILELVALIADMLLPK